MRLAEEIVGSSKQHLLTGVAASLVLIVAVIAIVREVAGPPIPKPPTQAWYYDLNTGKLFAGPIDAIPPITAPSGPLSDGVPAGVLAHVYSCTTCEEKNLAVVYLETRTPEAHKSLQAFRELPRGVDPPSWMTPALGGAGILVKRPKDTNWVDHDTVEAHSVEDTPLFTLCPSNVNPHACLPGN